MKNTGSRSRGIGVALVVAFIAVAGWTSTVDADYAGTVAIVHPMPPIGNIDCCF